MKSILILLDPAKVTAPGPHDITELDLAQGEPWEVVMELAEVCFYGDGPGVFNPKVRGVFVSPENRQAWRDCVAEEGCGRVHIVED